MQPTRTPVLAGALVLIIGSAAAIATLLAQPAPQPAAPDPGAHRVVSAKATPWLDPPTAMPRGGQIAVLAGDPGKEGPFVIRIKLPSGYRVPPHWHPTDEHLTIIQGTFLLGMGEKFDVAGVKPLNAGDYAFMPKEMRHFATTKGETVVQVNGEGPFVMNYVNPDDDPRNKKTATKPTGQD
jgi:quercetin dioxygenase-like cupin family protein